MCEKERDKREEAVTKKMQIRSSRFRLFIFVISLCCAFSIAALKRVRFYFRISESFVFVCATLPPSASLYNSLLQPIAFVLLRIMMYIVLFFAFFCLDESFFFAAALSFDHHNITSSSSSNHLHLHHHTRKKTKTKLLKRTAKQHEFYLLLHVCVCVLL